MVNGVSRSILGNLQEASLKDKAGLSFGSVSSFPFLPAAWITDVTLGNLFWTMEAEDSSAVVW